jgi:hypothetical protein
MGEEDYSKSRLCGQGVVLLDGFELIDNEPLEAELLSTM